MAETLHHRRSGQHSHHAPSSQPQASIISSSAGATAASAPASSSPSSHYDERNACVVVSVVNPNDASAPSAVSAAAALGNPSSTSSSADRSQAGENNMGTHAGPATTPYQVQQVVAKEGRILGVVYQRLSVLVSLLLLQSMSQFVLESFEDVVQANIVIPLFLTMLVGAGGNAGNQSAVRAIAMLAKGEINGSRLSHIMPVIKRECVIGFICAAVLSCIGALRVFAHQVMRRGGLDDSPAGAAAAPSSSGGAVNSGAAHGGGGDVKAGIAITVFAISASLFLIVFLSALIGVVLPFLFLRFGSNAENAAPAIQVIMDVLGVLLTCSVCWMLLPSAQHGGSTAAAAPAGKPPEN